MRTTLPKSFDALIVESKLPVLVDFWAEWCGACKMVSPAISRIARDLKGRIITIKVNVDKKQDIAVRYQITGIPTLMLFYKSKILMRLSGALPYESIRAELEKHLPH
ncbi:thioredoxin [bacterium]|nr:thioredoxin [bacterium]